jgi:MFS family permease
MPRLPRTVVVLGLASLLTDLSSEMIYPLLPAYLAVALGAGVIGLGAMEGAAEATASLLKIASGAVADRAARRKPFVVAGYSISGLARPLIGLARSWPSVIVLRLIDRVGKGIRTAPRDALIADVTEAGARGRAFGLHRAMDNGGAVLGPAVAALLLWLGFEVRQVFLSAAVPALIVVAVLLAGIRERGRGSSPASVDVPTPRSTLGVPFRRLLVVVVVFTLGNSSDMFILLRLGDVGLGPTGVTLAWAAHNLVKTLAVYLGGPVADRVDRKKLLLAGWLFYALTYAALAIVSAPSAVVALLIGYAIYFGFVEATERALVADLAPSALRGSAYGYFHGAVGLAALPASALFAIAWRSVGPELAFGIGALLSLVAAAGLAFWVPAPAER